MNDPTTYRDAYQQLKNVGQNISTAASDAYTNAALGYESAKLATKQAGLALLRTREKYNNYNSNTIIGFEVLSRVPVILTFIGLLMTIFATLVLAADKYDSEQDYEKFIGVILAGCILSLIGFLYLFYNFNSQMELIRQLKGMNM